MVNGDSVDRSVAQQAFSDRLGPTSP